VLRFFHISDVASNAHEVSPRKAFRPANPSSTVGVPPGTEMPEEQAGAIENGHSCWRLLGFPGIIDRQGRNCNNDDCCVYPVRGQRSGGIYVNQNNNSPILCVFQHGRLRLSTTCVIPWRTNRRRIRGSAQASHRQRGSSFQPLYVQETPQGIPHCPAS
jgi:hypothetical protein